MIEGDKNYDWFKVADTISNIPFAPNGLTEILVNNKKVCLALHKGILTATAATCPHAGAKLCDGYIDVMGNIVCPLHHYRFNVQNGRNTSGEGYFLKIFSVEISPDGVFVGIKKNNTINF